MGWVIIIRRIVFFIGCIFISLQVFAASLESIVINENNEVTIKIQGTYTYKYFVLHKPERFVIDLANVKQSTSKKYKEINHSKNFIKNIRTGINKNNLRVVLDIAGKKKFVVIKNKTGLLIKFKVENATKKKLRDVVVVLDPGHGGKDPGAVGPRGYKEKDIVLKVAKHLKDILDKEPGIRSVLTRSGDYYIGLRQRLQIARKNDADLFISIHADAAYLNRNSQGVSVFALSNKGATSEAARWLAEKENHSELGGVDFTNLADDSLLIRKVLIDLSQTATIHLSVELGKEVLKSLNKLTNLHHPNVEQARFVVLKSPDITSILIETGFISSRVEEKRLINNAYQKKLASSIALGIKNYVKTFPPKDTLLESRLGPLQNLAYSNQDYLYDYQATVALLAKLDNICTSNTHM